MVYMKTYIFNHFYQRCLVPLTMVPRTSTMCPPKEIAVLKALMSYLVPDIRLPGGPQTCPSAPSRADGLEAVGDERSSSVASV